MSLFRYIHTGAAEEASSPDKRLRRMSRQELLELLLAEVHDANLQREEIAKTSAEKDDALAFVEHLKLKLNEKDDQIGRLKATLGDKDLMLQQLIGVVREMTMINEESERMLLLLKVEDSLADRYLHQFDIADGPGIVAKLDADTEDVPSDEPKSVSAHIDYLLAEPEPVLGAAPFAHGGEVR